MSKTRMGKRVASLLLSLVMMLSLLPTTVYATGGTGETNGAIVEETNTSDDNTVGGTTGNPELTGEDEGGGGTIGSEGETATVATIGSATYESLDEAITAVADGETIVVNAGEYTLNGSLNYTGKAFTIAAAEGAKVSFDMSAAVALHGAKITFNNVTFDYKTNGNYIGLQHADTLVYNNCTINGVVFLYAVNETFNSCKFYQDSADAYNVWTYGAQNVAFNGCTFNCVGKAVLVYNEGAVAKTDLTVKDTKFIASAPVEDKAAIEIDTSLMEGGATITVDDKTTAAGFDNGSNSGNPLWNDKKQTADTNKNTTVTVAGEKVFEPKATVVKPVSVNGTSYETLEDAIDAATPDANGVVTYEISGKVDVTATGWVQVAKSGLTGLTAVKFVGTTDDAKICINGGLAILADQNYDIDVSFEALALSKLNPTYGGDYGHSTNYFTTWLRNSGAAENTVTYTNCTFPNGVSNNQYGKTVFDNCKFTNGATGLYNLWNYGGSTEIKNSSFTGTRGIKAYSEGVDGGQIEVADTTFNGLGEKAAIVVSKATTVTLNKVDATECTKGLLQKDIDGGSLKTTIEANGTGISGKFDITATTTADAAKNEFNISAGTFTSEVSNDYCADGFEVKANDNGTYGVVEAATAAGDGTEANPYTLAQLGAMTRQEYIDAQNNRLNGTMYVTVGDYTYGTNGVLGNGVRDDTTGQIPDHSKLNAYGENGYLGEKNDGANGKSVVFVGGSITSGVTGYTSIDKIGTSLLLALPAYTDVTFKGITFNNVMSFNYQLYTSPWSQLGELKFDGCTFNGIIVGAIAAQTLTFNKCVFENYTNTTDANSSNPTWIRPAYGNWTQGDNEGQGSDFKSLTTINFTDNKVTSTRPVKFEYISQWDITSTVTATGNSFDISKQDGDTTIKNVGLYLGAHTDANAFNLVAENNTKSENTAALYTIPEGKTSLPLGSTVTDIAGKPVELTDALKWKAGDATADKIVLKSVPLDTSIDLDTFIKAVVAAGYTYDGKGVTVKWSPVSGCYDTRAGHTCTAGGVIATGNTPKRVNNGLTQFQLFEGENVNVTVKNVKFEYVPAAFTVCENSNWKGSFTAEQAPAGQLYFMTSGDVNFEGCTFDKVVLTSFNTTGTTTVKDCQFANVYNNYAIKDIRGANISVTGTTITNCGGGIMVSSTDKVEKVTIWKNTFTNVDVAGTAAENKVGTRALIQIASSGDYSGTSFNLTANTATDCGPVLRQLNQTVVESGKIDTVVSDVASLVKSGTTGLGTKDSLLEQPVPAGYVEDEKGNVTISDEAGLFWFAKQANAGNNFAGKTVTLANDIALTKAWTPIGIYTDSKTHFKGTFDGQNHTVSGVKVLKYSANGVGFFGKVYTGTVKNLTVEGKITAYGCNYVGGIVGHGYATITNCTFKGTITNNGGYQVGGIAGSGGFTIKDCAVYGDISAESWVGGIAGNVQDGGTFTNCYVEGTISANSAYAGASAAGIAAIPLYKTQKISGCYSNTVVKCGDGEINAPIIGAYNSGNNITAETELFIYDNSWNKQKNSNDSYSVSENGTVIEGKDVSRDNNLVMLEDDLQYVTDLSKVRIMAGSAVTQAQVDALAAASIGTAKYITLAAAIAAANNGETVTLLKDVTENVEIAAGKELTLDLNGKTLSGGTGTANAALRNLGTITIQDTSAAQTGTIKRDDNGTVGETSYYVIRNQGTMTIESGNVINNSGYAKANSTGSMVGSSLICNGDCDEGGTLTIKGGTFTQNNFIAIKNGALGVLHVTGGKITSNHSAIQNWFKADITGGEINGQLWTDAYIAGESVGKTTIGGDATFTGEIVMDITGSVVPTLAINGGNLNVTKWRITNAAANAGAKPVVSGGTFTSAVPEAYCAEGFIPTANADGTYGVKAGAYVAQIGDVKYETLQAAIDAVKANETVTLLVNTTEDVTINKNITLDLGGKTLTNTSSGKATISVKDSAVVTVKNGSVMGGTSYYNIEVTKGSNANLTLMDVTATAGNTGSSMIDNWGTLTIESGTYEGGLNVVKSEEGSTLTINGGKFTGTYAPSSDYTAVILVYGNTTITGGEFIQSVTKTGSWAHPKVVMTGVVEGYEAFTTVTGGTFTNKKSGESIFHGLGKATSDNFEVSGGTFNKSVPDSYFKDGYFAKKTADGYTADGPYAVKIGTAAGYATLEEAFAAAKSGDTITLLMDCESGRINLEDKSITVDLNGKVLTSTAAYGVMFCAKNGHKITVKGTTAGSKLVGTLMVTAETDGRIEINGGTYESAQYCPIYINGAVSSENSKLTVKNATITALPGDSNQDNGVAVYLAGYSTSTFTKTTITAPVTGLEIRAGKLTLTNCTVTGGSGEVVTNANGNGTTVTNAAVAISQHTTKKNIDVTITGGTYTAKAAVYQTNVQGTGSENVTVSIKSGTFKGAVSAETNNTVAISGGTFSSAVKEEYCATGYIPTANADGTYGVKEGVYVAKVDNVKYETLQEAINAAKGGSTVRLLANVTLTETAVFPAGKTVHLNLVGHNITATGTALRINGTTDIQSTGSNGVIESTGNVAVAVGNNASLTVYSGTLKGREGAVITGTSTGAKIEIRKNATLIATDNAVIAGNGSKRDGKPNTILVKGSTFIGGIVTEGYIACGIYAPWKDNVTVSGGTFNITNGAGIVARAGTVKVTGGTFNCTGTAEGYVGDSKNMVPCAALVFDKAANYPALTESSQILVSGGSFSTDPAANGATLAAGYVANKDESGMYKVAKANPVAAIGDVKYDTLQAAINAAQDTKDGATITLLTDINTSSYYEVKGENPVTIDLAGHNITGSGISGLFYVTVKGDLTIKGEGTVTAVEDNGAAMVVWVRSSFAKVTLEGGTYTQQITNTADPHFDLIYVEYGNVYVKGGTYEGATPDWTLNCKDGNYPDEANIEVTGGTFVGFDPANNKAEGKNTNFVPAGYVSTKGADGNFVVTEVKVAEVNGVAYATLSEAIAAAKDGDIVTLLRDINTPEISYMISKSLTIDLNGMTVTGSGYDAVFQIDNADAKVVIKNGKVVAVEQSGSAGKYTMAIWASKAGCEVTLEGLDVSQKITHTDDPQMDMIYASGGTITINSGNFVSGTPEWTLNCYDTSYKNGTANIIVKGGTFVGFDPANNKAEGKGTNFVAAGYVSRMDEDGSYTVVPEDAKITVNKSLTLGNTLTMTYKVLLPEGYTSEKMVFEFYNDDIKGYDTVEVLNGNYNNTTKRYEFAFTGINPQRMNDTLKAKMYAKDANGNEVIYSVDDYSVAMYCNALLSSEANKDGKYTKLIASLVAYGTASQKYMNYRTDTLVSSIVDAGAADDYTAQLAAVQAVNNRIPGTGVTIKAKSLVLTNAFAIRVKFVLDSNVSIDDVHFTVNSDSTQYKEFKQSTLSDGTVCYYFDYTGLNASELDDAFTFTAHTGTGTGDALTYNANTYLNGMYKVLADRGDTTSALYEIVTALFNYGWTCNHF